MNTQIWVSPTGSLYTSANPLNSVCCAYYEDLPKQELSPHSAHTEEQADWLEMQQVTAAMGLVKKLPGRQGPPDPPPVLSADERRQQEREGEIKRGGEEQGWEDRREGRGGELSRWSRESRRKAQRDVAASQHSDNHLAIIRERARQRDKEKIKQETYRRQNRGRWNKHNGQMVPLMKPESGCSVCYSLMFFLSLTWLICQESLTWTSSYLWQMIKEIV